MSGLLHPGRRGDLHGRPLSDFADPSLSGNPAWATELSQFRALCSEGSWESFRRALALVRDGGYSVTADDVPAAVLPAFRAYVLEKFPRGDAPGLIGGGWT